jgi:hypothetical protein
MAKDARGVTINEGDLVLFNGLMMTIKSITGGTLLRGDVISQNKVTGMIVPGVLTCEIKIEFDPSPDKGIPCYALKSPSNQDNADKSRGQN